MVSAPVDQSRSNRFQSLFLVLPVPFRRQGGKLLFEFQACNGLERWAENFETLTIACPLIPESLADADSNLQWQPVRRIGLFSPITNHRTSMGLQFFHLFKVDLCHTESFEANDRGIPIS